jgi:hypothetical protein
MASGGAGSGTVAMPGDLFALKLPAARSGLRRLEHCERGSYKLGVLASWSAGGVLVGATESHSVKSRVPFVVLSARIRRALPSVET